MSKYLVVLLLSIFYLLCSTHCYGQKAVTLDSIFISEKPFTLSSTESKHHTSDSTSLELLSLMKTIISGQLQSVTPGGLNTLLYRGMSHRQLQILWHGANIQSIINGSYDLSLIPSFLIPNIALYSAGSPSILGNNGTSGSLLLHSTKDEGRLGAQVSISSLQNASLGVKTSQNYKNYSQQVKLAYGYENNIFTYQDGPVYLKRAPTKFKQANFLYDGQYFLSNKSAISLHVWLQNADRNILTSITSSHILQIQKDKNLRSSLDYTYYTPKYIYRGTTNIMREYIDYTGPNIISTSDVSIIMMQVEMTEAKDKDRHIQVNYRQDLAKPNFYLTPQKRSTLSILASKKIKLSDNTQSQWSIRQDMVDSRLMPFSFSTSVNTKNYSFQLAKNYNLPGFNDLYWPNGGNSSLKTEKSVLAEANAKIQVFGVSSRLSVYSNLVDNWIQWTPNTQGIWYAANQKKVWSRGVEINFIKSVDWQKSRLSIETSYGWNRTTSIDHYTDSRLIGKQLIYIPIHKFNLMLAYTHKNHKWTSQLLYGGKRYNTSDNSERISAYQLVHVNYAYSKQNCTYQWAVNNIFSEQYDIVRFFPQPQINTSITIFYTLK